MRCLCTCAVLMLGLIPVAADSLHAKGVSMPTPSDSDRTYAWRRHLDHGSFEHAVVRRREKALFIEGDILAVHEGEPLHVTYAVATDDDGISRSLTVRQRYAGEDRRLVLDRAPDGSWSVDGRPMPELAGCLDVDLGLSPSTNALPIGRMQQSGLAADDIRVAWVRFPSLAVVPATQRYTRIAPRQWRYENLDSGFNAVLGVDDWGLPVDYQGVWTQAGMARHGPFATSAGFTDALVSDGPSTELADHAQDFDWLVGGWRAQVRDVSDDGTVQLSRGEWWFAWVLDGRAMQDVWISPPRVERADNRLQGQPGNRYGTSIRRWDRSRQAWRVTWINPVTGAENELLGTRNDDAIVLLGTADGRPIKWQFVDIEADRFTWQGFRLEPDGRTWRLQAEFKLQRIGPAREAISASQMRQDDPAQ